MMPALSETQRLRHLISTPRPRRQVGRAVTGFLLGLGLALAAFDGTMLALHLAKRDQVCACWGGGAAMTVCQEAQGPRDRQGYVQIKVAGHSMRAHRVAWERSRGPIPDGLCVLHRCDNPPCTRLDHLFLGTPGENNRDRALKGRSVSALGEKNNAAKLNPDQVLEIRERRARGESAIAIGKLFGVHRDTVYDIEKRRRWAHLA